MKKESFLLLLDKFVAGKCSSKEQEYIINYYESFQDKKDVFDLNSESEEEIRLKILSRIREDLSLRNDLNKVPKKIDFVHYKTLRSNIFKYAAIFIVALGIVYFFQISVTVKKSEAVDNNIVTAKPSVNSGEITLSLANGNIEVISENGERKVYDANGEIVGVQKGNQLNYTQNKDKKLEKLVYNELTVPYGKRFDLVLSDGTNVKLNAGTSIKYPIQFIKGKERKVFIEGEAYFDVTEDKNHPFIVNANNINVEVLGTEFNMSFYPEDTDISTVLVEGSVKLYEESNIENLVNKSTILTPGYKASWSKNKEMMSINKVDVNVYTAWKDGNLIFKNTSFHNILKKLERKFNIVIDNKYAFLDQQIYTAYFLDNETIENILEYFSEETSFNYTRENNKITIITNLTK